MYFKTHTNTLRITSGNKPQPLKETGIRAHQTA